MSITPPAQRYEVLDSLRGLCAVLVVLFHLKTTGSLSSLPFIRNAWLFVDFFFVLSGFVIASGYRERLGQGFPLRRFMFLRLARVYPLHLFVLLMFLVVETGKYLHIFPGVVLVPPFTSPRSIEELWQNVFLIQIFGLEDHDSWNAPAWSIAAEVWTYLLAGLVFARAGRFATTIAALTIAASLAVLASTGDGQLDRTFSMALVRCLFGFSCGVVALAAYRRFGALATGTAVEVLTLLGVIAFVTTARGPVTLAAPFVFVAAILVFAPEKGAISRLFRHRPFRFLGTLSYSIYMVHIFVQSRFIDLLLFISHRTGMQLGYVAKLEDGPAKMAGMPGQAVQGDFLAIAIVALSIGAAWLTFHGIEEPFRKWSKRRVKTAAVAEQAPVAF